MVDYYPDRWVVVEITGQDKDPIHKVFGSWRGGYISGEHWRMNSGIVDVIKEDNIYLFIGASGSQYVCPIGEDFYGATTWASGVLDNYIKSAKENGYTMEVLSSDYDFLKLGNNK